MPLFSNLDLHGDTPPRAQPRVGEWGPVGVPGTRLKRRMRWVVWTVFTVAVILLVILGWYVYFLSTGKGNPF